MLLRRADNNKLIWLGKQILLLPNKTAQDQPLRLDIGQFQGALTSQKMGQAWCNTLQATTNVAR